MMTDEQKKEEASIMKEAFKEAAKEWFNELASKFGIFSAMSILGALIVALGYFLLTINGWHK